ncbi:MAG: FtsH protease activity modulator HflK [Acidobacteriota bacterium]
MEPQDYIDLKKLGAKLDARKIGIGIGLLLILILVFTSWFQVGAESAGVVLRLGKYNRTVGPGLHFNIPFGIEVVSIVPSQRQLKEEFGFRTLRPGIRTQYSQQSFTEESLMLTADLNVASVAFSVQYRINDPYKYLFRVRHVRETFRDMAQAVMREIVGDRTVNEVLTVGRTELAVAAQEKLQKLCNEYHTGLSVEQVILQDITPPDPVKPSFNEVNQAQQEGQKLINQAKAEYNAAVPKARGEADQTIREAEGYAIDRVNRAKGEVVRFLELYKEYRKAPEVTRRRIYVETLGTVLPNIGRKLILDKDSKNIIPLLQLGKEAKGQ